MILLPPSVLLLHALPQPTNDKRPINLQPRSEETYLRPRMIDTHTTKERAGNKGQEGASRIAQVE